MPNEMEKIPVSVWKRFETPNLKVAASIAGFSHEFSHCGSDVRIALPRKPKQKDWRNESLSIECTHYRTRGRRKYPISYDIKSVDITIATGKMRAVPKNSIGVVNHGLFNSQQLDSFENFSNRYEDIIDSAFERWLDVLRWKTGIHTICPHHETRRKSLWGPYLLNTSNNKRFYRSIDTIVVNLQKSVSKKDWRSVQIELGRGSDVPIWHIFLAEACLRRDMGDTRGFILDLVVSIETIVRAVLREYIVREASPNFIDTVGRIGLGQILNKWGKINSHNKSWKKMSDELATVAKIVDERNRIMHRGIQPKLSRKQHYEYVQRVLNFLVACERQIR